MVDFCWEGECVRYGILFSRGVQISQGRFKCSDLDPLLTNVNFSFEETTPEALGLGKESEGCSVFNDFLFPPEFPPVIPPRLILEVKNNVTNRDIAPISVRFELIANPEIDRVSIVRTIWDFGDGSPPVVNEALFGSAPGFIQNHAYQEAIDFNGTVTLQILDSFRNILDQETVNFNGMVLGSIEETFTPLSIILDVFPDSTEAPANVDIAVIGNQAIEDIVVDWGDGSIPEAIGPNASHAYNNNGQFLIVVSATSRISGERRSQTDLLTLEMPAPPPGADQIIFEVRKAIAGNSLVAPATINYTLLLNPDLLVRTNKFKIAWTTDFGQDFDSGIREGDRLTGESQSFTFPTPGAFNIQVIVEQFDEFDLLIKSESFSDNVTIVEEEVEEEIPIIEPPVEDLGPCPQGLQRNADGTCPPVVEEPPIIVPPVEEVEIEISERTRNFIFIGIAGLIGAGFVVAATRE